MKGPGKYDAACEAARAETGAAATVLCVLDGKRGNGFSVTIDGARCTDPIKALAGIPAVLRAVADCVEADAKGLL